MTHITVNGAHVHVWDSGGAGEPLVLLHGFLFDGRQFTEQIAALRADYRCITIDFPGQGGSARPRGGYATDHLTDIVVEAIRSLDVGPVHLAGLSMGGFTGMRIAARYPELVRSLTLLNTSARPHPLAKFPKQVLLAVVARVAGVGLPPVIHGAEKEMYGTAFRTDPATLPIRETWRRRWAAADRAALVGTLAGFMARPDFRPELARITAPVLIIAGAEDASLPPHLSGEMHALMPGSRLVVVPGAGHSSPMESPETVTAALRAFISEVGGRVQ